MQLHCFQHTHSQTISPSLVPPLVRPALRLCRTILVATLAHFYHRYYYDYVWCVRIFVAPKRINIFPIYFIWSLSTLWLQYSFPFLIGYVWRNRKIFSDPSRLLGSKEMEGAGARDCTDFISHCLKVSKSNEIVLSNFRFAFRCTRRQVGRTHTHTGTRTEIAEFADARRKSREKCTAQFSQLVVN